NKVWRVVTAKVAVGGPSPSVSALDSLLYLDPKVHISGGPGQFTLSGELDHGIAKASVGLTATGGKYTRPELRLEGSADAQLKIANWNLDGGAPEIGGSSLKLTDVYMVGAQGHSRGWWGKFGIPSGRVANNLTGKVSMECRDARPLLTFLGEGLPKWAQGALEL